MRGPREAAYGNMGVSSSHGASPATSSSSWSISCLLYLDSRWRTIARCSWLSKHGDTGMKLLVSESGVMAEVGLDAEDMMPPPGERSSLAVDVFLSCCQRLRSSCCRRQGPLGELEDSYIGGLYGAGGRRNVVGRVTRLGKRPTAVSPTNTTVSDGLCVALCGVCQQPRRSLRPRCCKWRSGSGRDVP